MSRWCFCRMPAAHTGETVLKGLPNKKWRKNKRVLMLINTQHNSVILSGSQNLLHSSKTDGFPIFQLWSGFLLKSINITVMGPSWYFFFQRNTCTLSATKYIPVYKNSSKNLLKVYENEEQQLHRRNKIMHRITSFYIQLFLRHPN